jgi:hypothetical protein
MAQAAHVDNAKIRQIQGLRPRPSVRRGCQAGTDVMSPGTLNGSTVPSQVDCRTARTAGCRIQLMLEHSIHVL